MAECVGHRLQNFHGLFGDFRTDAVAGQDGYVQEHAVSLMETDLSLQSPGELRGNFIRVRPYISTMMRPSAAKV